MTSLDHRFLGRLGAAATAAALVLPVLPAAASDAPAAPPARTMSLACPADRVSGMEFADTAGSVHEDSIRCLAWYGIAKGSSDGTYAGERSVTRAQLATFLARVLEQAGVSVPTAAADAFVDDNGNAHEANLNGLAALGIVKGGADGEVNPDDAVRRDQMASLLVRALELIENDDLADVLEDYFEDDDENVHAAAINALAGLGIAAGRGDGVFDPSSDVRREQLATFLMRLVDRLVEQDRVRVPLTLRLSAEEVTAGQVVTGVVLGDDIDTVALSGCGVDGPVADEDTQAPGVQFSLTVPTAFPADSDDVADAPQATDTADGGDEASDAPTAADTADGGDDSGADSGDAADECELEVVVTLLDGSTVTLDAELEFADAEDGSAEDGSAEDGSAEDGSAEDGSAEDGSAEDGSAEDGSAEEGGSDDSADEPDSADDADSADGADTPEDAGDPAHADSATV